MDAIVPICGSAKTAIHNNVFLEGVKSALIAPRLGVSLGVGKGQKLPNDNEWTSLEKEIAMKAFARVYAGWGLSQAFYREKLHEKHFDGQGIDEFMVSFWDGWASKNDPENCLAMLQTWQLGDISAGFGHDFAKAMGSIKANALIAPAVTDLYFPPEDSQIEVENMAPGKGTLLVIPTIWGHWAGGPGISKEDWEYMDKKMDEFLSKA